MKKSFREKLVDNGFNNEQIEKIEKVFLEETNQTKVSGGIDEFNRCPFCGGLYSSQVWEEHYDKCPARPK